MFAGVKAPHLAAMLEPRDIAETIYKAVKRNDLWVMEPMVVKTVPFLRAVFPTRIVDGLSSLLGMDSSMDTWVGRRT